MAPEIRTLLEEVLPDREAVEAFLLVHSDLDPSRDQLELVRLALAHRRELEAAQQPTSRSRKPRKPKQALVKAPPKTVRKVIDDGQLLHTARTLALCSMPYDRTDETELVRKVTLDGTTIYVRFSTYDKSIPLPFGKDRIYLTSVMTKALEQRNPRVTWDSARSILESFQMSKGGRQLAELKEAMTRICNVVIGFGVMHSETPEPGRDRGSKIIYEWSMPTKRDVEAEDRGERHLEGEPYYLEIEPKTYNQLLERPVSLPSRVLQQHMNSPLTWDFLNFLAYQSTCTPMGEEKVIPLSHILTFLGTEDSNIPRLKAKLQEVIDDLDGFLGEVSLQGRGSKSFLFLEGRGRALPGGNPMPALSSEFTPARVAEEPHQGVLLEGELTPDLPLKRITSRRRRPTKESSTIKPKS